MGCTWRFRLLAARLLQTGVEPGLQLGDLLEGGCKKSAYAAYVRS